MSGKDYSYAIPDHPIEYARVDPTTIKFDSRAQRNLNKARARAIAEKLVPTAIGTPILSQREDGYQYAVDGMHRVYACQLILSGEVKVSDQVHEAIKAIYCEIHTDLSMANEASLFIINNKESSKVGANDEFRIGVLAGHPLFVDTNVVLEKHQLKVGSRSANGVRGIKGILNIVEEHGPDVLDQSLAITEEAWGRGTDTWQSVTIGGIALVISKHPDVVKHKELAQRLGKQGGLSPSRTRFRPSPPTTTLGLMARRGALRRHTWRWLPSGTRGGASTRSLCRTSSSSFLGRGAPT